MSQAICVSCKAILDTNLVSDRFAADGADFCCGGCSAVVAQIFECRRCDALNVQDLTNDDSNKGRCALCRQPVARKYTVVLPVVSGPAR